jgi:hypothetical protein
MERQQIFDAISKERAYQDVLWGPTFDDYNTADDWATFITYYVTRSLVSKKFDQDKFVVDLIKVAALAVAAIETCNRTRNFSPRHWENTDVKT